LSHFDIKTNILPRQALFVAFNWKTVETKCSCGIPHAGQHVDADLLKDFPANAYSTLARVALLTSVVGSFPVFMFIVRSSLCKVRKRIHLLRHFMLKMHHFTKTGSVQTWGKQHSKIQI